MSNAPSHIKHFNDAFEVFQQIPPPPLRSSRRIACYSRPICRWKHGDERVRTADLLVANQMLSQLSYVPEGMIHRGFWNGPGWSRTNDLTLIRGAL